MEVGEGLKLEVYVCEIYSNAFDTGYILVQYHFLISEPKIILSFQQLILCMNRYVKSFNHVLTFVT